MKRILCVILAILLLTPTALAEEEKMLYRLTGDAGDIGDIVKLTVSVENAPACATYESTFTYDPEVLKPTGDYQKMKLNGLLAVNTDAEQDGKKVVKVAAVVVLGDLLKGDMDLLNISFEVIGKTKEKIGSLIDVASYNFALNNDELTPVDSLILQPCYMIVPIEGEAEEPSAPKPDAPAGNDTEKPTDTPDKDTADKTDKDTADKTDKDPADKTDKDTDKNSDKENQWFFHEDQAVLFDPENVENSQQYKVEYEKDESGKTTGVTLYDEDKNEVGKLEVTEDEYGNLDVQKEDLKKEEKPFSPWFLLPIGAAVLIAIGGVVIAIIAKKKKK